MRDPILTKAIEAAGGVAMLARKLGIKPQAISQWSRVPAERVADVAVIAGIPAAELRPDLAETFGIKNSDPVTGMPGTHDAPTASDRLSWPDGAAVIGVASLAGWIALGALARTVLG